MKRKPVDDERQFRRANPVDSISGTPLWETPASEAACEESHLRTPLNIRTPLPIAPGSETSREASESVNRRKEIERVLIWFAARALILVFRRSAPT